MTERHARILGRLAELGMALAEDLQGRALAADDAEDVTTLSAGFHRISRSVRQSLALEARLHREAERVRCEIAEDQAAQAARGPARRRAEARARLERLVWTEAEDEHTARYWGDGARRLLAAAEFEPDFETGSIDEVVETLAAALRDRVSRDAGPASSQGPEVLWTIRDTDGSIRTVYRDAPAGADTS